MGRWSANHWKLAAFGWLAFVVFAFAFGGVVGQKSLDPNTSGPGESGRVDRILDTGFKQPAGESVLIQSRSLTASDPAFTTAIGDVVARISKLQAVQHIRSPLDPANAGQIAPDRHAPLVEFDIRGDPDKAIDEIQPVVDRVAEAQAGAGTRTRSPGRSARRRRPSRGRDFDPGRPGGSATSHCYSAHK